MQGNKSSWAKLILAHQQLQVCDLRHKKNIKLWYAFCVLLYSFRLAAGCLKKLSMYSMFL